MVNALTLRFPHLKRDIQDQILALTSVEEAGGEEEIGVDSAGEGGSDSASEGEEESESESKGEDSAEHSDGGDEEAREHRQKFRRNVHMLICQVQRDSVSFGSGNDNCPCAHSICSVLQLCFVTS